VFQAEIVDLAKAASVGGATARSKVDPAEGREDRMMEALETLVRDLGGGTSGKVEPQ
jgi:hypothetical protein